MDYKHFGLEDFLQDEYFVRWVNHPDDETEKFWEGVLQRYPEKRAVMARARHVAAMFRYKKEYTLTDDERGVLRSQIGQPNPSQQVVVKSWVTVYRVAASLLMLLVAGTYFWFAMKSETEQFLVSEAVNEWQIKEVGKGKKLSVVLADGTKIKMNSSSKCSFPTKYRKGKVREFKLLQGEVFFEVAEDSTSPFIVYTGETATKVLGTSFNIKLDTADDKVEIALVSGKVSVKHAEDKLQLTPGEKINITSDNIVKSSFDPLLVTGWKDGVLVIDQMPFHEMVGQLEQWYGVAFHIANSVDTTGVYTGTYRNQSLENVLQGMGFTSELDFEIKKNSVFIK